MKGRSTPVGRESGVPFNIQKDAGSYSKADYKRVVTLGEYWLVVDERAFDDIQQPKPS
jgi:hypothetical protein